MISLMTYTFENFMKYELFKIGNCYPGEIVIYTESLDYSKTSPPCLGMILSVCNNEVTVIWCSK